MGDVPLPVDAEAEEAVLAAVMSGPEPFATVVELLQPDDFGIVAHQHIYAAALSVDARGKAVDAITVVDELRRTKTLTKAGGPERVNALAGAEVAFTSVADHAAIVADKSLLRSLALTGRNIAGEALHGSEPATELLERAEQRVFDLNRQRSGSSMVAMPDAVRRALSSLQQGRSSLLLGHSTGLRELDAMTSGFQGGQLVVIAARPAVGKSAFSAQIARHIAESSGKAVGIYTYEMTDEEITMRWLSSALSFNLQKLRQGDFSDGFELDLAAAAEQLAEVPLHIDDNPPRTIAGVRSSARRLARRTELGAIVIDYCQLMDADRRSRDPNRNLEISEISQGAKRLASELDVPVLLLSQLSRGVESRPSKRPLLSDLRDSGSLEQDASLVLFLYRDALYHPDADPTLAECIVAKQRNGPTGTVHLEFTPDCARFADTERRPPAGPSGNKRPGDPF